MKSMNRNGKTYWLVDVWEYEDLSERIRSLVGDPRIKDGEQEFVGRMAQQSASPSFNISNPQAAWLDKILYRCGKKTIFP